LFNNRKDRVFNVTLCIFFLSIILKDFFKILTFFELPNLNYVFLIIYPLVFVLLLLKAKTLKIDVLKSSFIIFYLWCFLSILVNYIFDNKFGYSYNNILIAIFFYTILPLIFLLIIAVNPKYFQVSIDKIIVPLGVFVLVTTVITFFLYLMQPDTVIDFFMALMKDDLIVNPIQSTSTEIQLRFSSIFYSSFTYALFCNFCLFHTLYNVSFSKLTRTILCFSFLLLIFLSLNRNGYVVFIFMALFYILRSFIFFNRFSVFLINFSFICLAIIIPFYLIVIDVSAGFNSVDSLYFKISTLFSRVNAWDEYFNNVSWIDFLFGNGFVQGLGDSEFFLDNSYYHVIATGGVAAFCLLIFVVFKFSVVIISSQYSDEKQFVFAFSLFSSGLLSMFVNNSFFEPIFLVLYVFYPLSLALRYKTGNYFNTNKV